MSEAGDYETTNEECKFPEYPPNTAYAYGCRCFLCRRAKQIERNRSKEGPKQCNAPGCEKPRRRVSGARYCAEHAQGVGYGPGKGQGFRQIECAHCHQPARVRVTTKHPICQDCRRAFEGLIAAASNHGVGLKRLLAWMDSPNCELCDRALYVGKGKGGACGFNVDHDHRHCDTGTTGCDECVRGLLCGRCNNLLGGVEKLREEIGLDRVLEYLDQRSWHGAQVAV